MKKRLVVLGVLVLASAMSLAQGTYYVDYFSNNAPPADQIVRIINIGAGGTPLTSPQGDVCANIYVFDNNQEMVACCACRLTPNELASASVRTQLTNNTVTSVVPTSGVIKIVPTLAAFLGGGTAACDPTNPFAIPDGEAVANAAIAGLVRVYGTHLQETGGAIYVSEVEKSPSLLSGPEAFFLPRTCAAALYFGSGQGTCSCTVPGH